MGRVNSTVPFYDYSDFVPKAKIITAIRVGEDQRVEDFGQKINLMKGKLINE